MTTPTETHWSLRLRAFVAVQVFFLLGSLFVPLTSVAAVPTISHVKVVGTATHSTGFFGTLVVTVPGGGVAAGHSIIISMVASSNAGPIACSDSKFNVYSLDVQAGGGGTPRSAILSAHNVTRSSPATRSRVPSRRRAREVP